MTKRKEGPDKYLLLPARLLPAQTDSLGTNVICWFGHADHSAGQAKWLECSRVSRAATSDTIGVSSYVISVSWTSRTSLRWMFGGSSQMPAVMSRRTFR